MQTIFSIAPGTVAVIRSPGVMLPFAFVLGGWGSGQNRMAVITTLAGQTESGVQFTHTLRSFIYTYVFGERMGTLAVGGKIFLGRCGGMPSFNLPTYASPWAAGGGGSNIRWGLSPVGGGTVINDGVAGLSDYYSAARVSNAGAGVGIQIGVVGLAGFLVGMKMQIENEQIPVGSFGLAFQTLPNG